MSEVYDTLASKFEDSSWTVSHSQTVVSVPAEGWFAFAEAVFAVLAGDHETALSKLQQALEGGFTVNPQLSKTWPMFEPLNGDPRFEGIMNRMVEHLNSERAKMGLPPL